VYKLREVEFMKRMFVCFVLFFLISSTLFAQVRSGNAAWIAVRTAPLKTSTWFFAGTRGNLQMGDEVMVIQLSGTWAEVRSAANPSLSGWTSASNLSPRLVVATSTGATATEVALAGKGFSKEVEDVYRAEGDLNYADVDRMEAITISQTELLRFMQEGRLNTGEPR
jgi:hypothetical protein